MARSRSARTLLAELLETAEVPVYVLDEKRQIIYCNSACASWVGATVEQLIGLRCDYHSQHDLGRGQAIAAGLCPPSQVFSGEAAEGLIAAPRQASESVRRSSRFVPLGSDVDRCVGVITVAGQSDLGRLPESSTDDESEPAQLHERVRAYRDEARRHYHLDRLAGESRLIKRVREQVALAASSQARVVVIGPQGSGREHVARTIHHNHPQAEAASLIPLDCTLLDSELLQATVSAFVRRWTEAERDPASALLLLEIDCLDADAQRELMGFLDIGEFGFRTIATARHHLLELAEQGKFRRDLALALSTLVIELPSLAQRREDLPLLAQLLLEELNAAGQRQLSGFTPEAMDQLVAHPWPGNLDELTSTVRAASQRAAGAIVRRSDLSEHLMLAADALAHPPHEEEQVQLDAFLRQIEGELVARALRRSKGNKAQAARLLGISRPRLLRLKRQLDSQV
jgi:DNA-binding NtrC family response regulator